MTFDMNGKFPYSVYMNTGADVGLMRLSSGEGSYEKTAIGD